jgi:cardiolipin synthase
MLTLSRMLLLPIFTFGFFMQSAAGGIVSLSIFIICCITDYLDGYYARAYKQSTKMGRILDPLADKLLISITLLFICGFNMVSRSAMIPAAVILCREIIISGIRDAEELSGNDFKTSLLSKWKTTTQMIAAAIVLYSAVNKSDTTLAIGEVTLWLSSIIAIVSGLVYLRNHFPNA